MSSIRNGSRTHSQTKDSLTPTQFDKLKKSLAEINMKLNELVDLKALVHTLKEQIAAKDRKIDNVQQHVDDLEQYTRQDDIIISRFKTRHKSYA